MAIKIDTPITVEVLEYTNILLVDLNIKQSPTNDNSVVSVYNVTITYKIYAVDNNNNRKYKGEVYEISVPNYLEVAKAQNTLGDDSMLLAMSSIEKVMSKLITEKGTVGNTSVIV